MHWFCLTGNAGAIKSSSPQKSEMRSYNMSDSHHAHASTSMKTKLFIKEFTTSSMLQGDPTMVWLLPQQSHSIAYMIAWTLPIDEELYLCRLDRSLLHRLEPLFQLYPSWKVFSCPIRLHPEHLTCQISCSYVLLVIQAALYCILHHGLFQLVRGCSIDDIIAVLLTCWFSGRGMQPATASHLNASSIGRILTITGGIVSLASYSLARSLCPANSVGWSLRVLPFPLPRCISKAKHKLA